MGVLGVFASVVGHALAFPSNAGNTAVTVDDLIGFVDAVETAISTVGDVFQTADDRMAAAVTAAQDAGDQVAAIGEDIYQITRHTYDTVIPLSLNWLRGDLILHYIDPLRADIRRIDATLRALTKWENQIKAWRKNTVDPELKQWEEFRRFFYTWPYPTLQTVHDWLQHPRTFSNWATPILTGPMVQYLGGPNGSKILETLAGEVLLTVPEDIEAFIIAAGELLETNVPVAYGP